MCQLHLFSTTVRAGRKLIGQFQFQMSLVLSPSSFGCFYIFEAVPELIWSLQWFTLGVRKQSRTSNEPVGGRAGFRELRVKWKQSRRFELGLMDQLGICDGQYWSQSSEVQFSSHSYLYVFRQRSRLPQRDARHFLSSDSAVRQSVLNHHRHWLKIWAPHIPCQLLQISLHISDEISPKWNELTTRPMRCENMLCFDWTFASFTAKTLEFNMILGLRPPSACVSAVIEHRALIFFFFFVWSLRRREREKARTCRLVRTCD